ncbi:DUF4880 domain-containing protein [Alteromonas pelagimontana]|uniref:DUF4880 domain-containing protein n=1 Tax=Alteromonas pelagimontana TaxID=1858656 RepID=A0A6M4MDQ9_9ALTE|nr:FecR domain-containing protein [Alteromonas pelagimontana]QJR80725.1 DUF4880 domain-containing protein [Alteromonas pelagimontana]
MASTDKGAQERVYIQAAEWLDKLSEGDLDNLSKHRFIKWLELDLQHRQVFERMLSTWHDPSLALASKKLRTERGHESLRDRGWGFSFWQWGASFACMAVIAVAAFQWHPLTSDEPAAIVLATDVNSDKETLLEDGSQVQMQSASEVVVAFSEQERRINLRKGQAYFAVAKNKQRPFIVKVGAASVTAVGTAFNIDRGHSQTDVTVYEGAVEVLGAIGQPSILLKAGERVRITQDQPGAIEQVNISNLVDWRSGWIEISRESLEFLVERLNRHSQKPIVFAEAGIGAQNVAGRFRLDDVEQALALLEKLHDLKIEHTPQEIRITRGSRSTNALPL